MLKIIDGEPVLMLRCRDAHFIRVLKAYQASIEDRAERQEIEEVIIAAKNWLDAESGGREHARRHAAARKATKALKAAKYKAAAQKKAEAELQAAP